MTARKFAYVQFADRFTVVCNRCKSTAVDVSIDDCDMCGATLNGYCTNCKAKYRYHDFEETEGIDATKPEDNKRGHQTKGRSEYKAAYAPAIAP